MIDRVLVQQELNKRKISASKAEVDAVVKELVSLFESEEDFKKQLAASGISEESLRAQMEYQLRIEKLQDQLLAHISVTEDELREAYERVRTSHILIRPEGSTDEDWAAAEQKAWEIYNQVTPENFAELAAEVSDDSTSSQGGELGYIYRGKTVPEFEEAAFALGVGEISEPVRSTYGYHIITVTDRIEAEGEDFENSREQLAREIRLEKGAEDLSNWLAEQRKASDIVLMESRLNAFAQMQAENYEDAAHYYKLAIEEEPDNPYLYTFLGDAYYEMGDLQTATEQYKLAVEKAPEDYTLLYSLGKLYEEAEDIDQAVAQYIKAAELVPNDIFALLTLYYSVTGLERWDDAKAIEKLIEEYQERQNALLQGQDATEAGEEEAAEETAEEPAEEQVEEEPSWLRRKPEEGRIPKKKHQRKLKPNLLRKNEPQASGGYHHSPFANTFGEETEMTLTNRPRGTNDVGPGEIELWHQLEEKIRQVCSAFGYKELRTPIFEHTELFQRGIGEATDIVEKEMYTFMDRGQRSLTLRPEGTAPLVRAFVENRYGEGALPVKLYYLGPMFRYERPQAGRYRQFTQFGLEALGSADPLLDVEAIVLPLELYKA